MQYADNFLSTSYHVLFMNTQGQAFCISEDSASRYLKKHHNYVGWPSVCCEYAFLPEVSKEAVLAKAWQNVAWWEIQEERRGKRKAE